MLPSLGQLAVLAFGGDLRVLFFLLPVVVAAVSVHEFAHAASAYLLGDRWQSTAGRLTLNPLRHFEWTGFLALLIFGFGWGRPVEINPRAFRHPRLADTTIALAGPASNLLLAWASLLLGLRVLLPQWAGQLLWYSAMINTSLAVFNLLPIPPLDGSHLLYNLLPQRARMKFLAYGPLGIMLLFTLFMAERIFRVNLLPLEGMISAVFRLLHRLALSTLGQG